MANFRQSRYGLLVHHILFQFQLFIDYFGKEWQARDLLLAAFLEEIKLVQILVVFWHDKRFLSRLAQL